MLLDATYADTEWRVYLTAGKADEDGLGLYQRLRRESIVTTLDLGMCSRTGRSHKLVTIGVQNVGRLGREGSSYFYQAAMKERNLRNE